jgi:hypothetical protein
MHLSITTPKQYCPIRVPAPLHERLVRLSREILCAKEAGRGYDDVPLADQGEKGVFVPLYGVIDRALDEFEGHRRRSNRRPRKKTAKALPRE